MNNDRNIALVKLIFTIFIIYTIYLNISSIKTTFYVKKFYSQINSPNNKKINDTTLYKVKYDIKKNVKESNLYKKSNKKYIIDSLQNIPIIIIKSHDIILKKNTAAAFFNTKEITKELIKIKTLKNLKIKHNYLILVNENTLNNNHLNEILMHEYYHYLDELLNNISDTIKNYHILDDNLSNNIHTINKVIFLFNLKDDKVSKKLEKHMLLLSDDIFENITYLSRSEEIFARWKTFKTKLVLLNYIDNINSEVNSTIIKEYIQKNEPNLFDLELLMVLNLDKIEILDKITN